MFRKPELREWLTSVARVSSAALILEDEAGRALIVKANYKSHWTFPGGVIDPNESPLEGAVRETREEVGLIIDPSTVTFAWVANRASSVADTYQFVFRAAAPRDAAAHVVLQPSEIDDHAWITKADVAAGGRHYGKVIEHWARGAEGYVEQTFGV